MTQHNKESSGRRELHLARTLGIPEVALLGVGALLGGGIFTLLGHAAGLAGGGLVFSMLIGSAISFVNLNAYVALATTFPGAGGGYKWVKDGLGDLNGFLSGWCSWLASVVACALYSVSFGLFAGELLFDLLKLPTGNISVEQWELILTVIVVALFGSIHYNGVKLSGKIGGIITIIVLAILALFIAFGIKSMALDIPRTIVNFTPLLPMGIAGILQAAALFYIAFEGSEIQAQTGEEVENPAKVLKIGLFSSWALVSLLYVLIAIVIVGATNGGGASSWSLLGGESERAIITSASQFMPFGYIAMLIGGLLANIGALNATIYSSSRVFFAMARDKFVLSWFGVMNPISYIPARALVLSVVAIMFIATMLPLTDIASMADILFIALFIQLNIAYIQLRREKPEARWRYVVPFEPYLPIMAVVLYCVLGIALFHVSPTAIYFFAVWILLGLVNYLGYTKRVEREDHAREVVYEHSMRFHPKSEYRVVLPIGTEGNLEKFTEIASAMTKEEGGDLIALRIHEMADGDDIADAFHSQQNKKDLQRIEEDMAKKRINTETRIIASHSVPTAILETIAQENADLVLLNWDGSVDTKGFIFGRKIDTVLHRAKCDLLAAKLGTEESLARIFIPVSIDHNPNLRFTGKVATALYHAFGSYVTVAMIVPEDVRGRDDAYYLKLLEERVRELKIKKPNGVESKLIYSDYLTSGILKATTGTFDVILMPAARSRLTRAIGVGTIPEQVAKNCRRKTVLIAKGYRGVTQPFWDYIRGVV